MYNQSQFLQYNNAFISFIQRLADIASIWGGLYLLIQLDNGAQSVAVWYSAITVTFIYILMAESKKLYGSWRGKRLTSELFFIIFIIMFAMFFVFIARLYAPSFFVLSETILLQWLFFSCVSLFFIRLFFRLLMRYLRKIGYNHKSVIIIGAGDLGKKLAMNLVNSPWLGYDLEYFMDDTSKGDIKVSQKKIVIKNNINEVLKNITNIDRVYITLPMRAESRIREIVDLFADTTVSVYLVPDIFTFELLHSRLEVFNGIPSVSIHESPFIGINSFLKRLEDIIFSIIILTLISVPLLLISLAVKSTSKGPILFKQKRYGLDGKGIEVWKYRTMNVMENGGCVKQAKKNDDRFTPIGSFLRRTSLDELPQFINVLTGQMSIVGPRPHAVAHNEEYRKLVRGYMLRHKVKPGITGWAQINGWRGETDTLEKMEKRVEYDLYYIHNWSIALDIKIIFLTIFKGFINKNAY